MANLNEPNSTGPQAQVVPLQRMPGGADVVRIGREPPAALAAEHAVLALCLQSASIVDRAVELGLEAEHFFDGRNGAIFGAIRDLHAKGRPANPITLQGKFAGSDVFADGEDPMAFLATLRDFLVPLGHADEMIGLVLDAHGRRAALEAFENAASSIHSPDGELRETLANVGERLFQIETATSRAASTGPVSIGKAFELVIDRADRAFKRDGIVGVPTGYDALDEQLGGLHPSDLIIIAGRPSMGKTALATKIAYNAASKLKEEIDETTGARRRLDGGRAVVFSVEMSAEQLANRLMGDLASIPSDKIRRGTLSARDFPVMVDIAQSLKSMTDAGALWIEDKGNMTVPLMRSTCRRIARKCGPIHLIVVDYLQLLTDTKGGGRNAGHENRQQEISAITRGLKSLAKELDCPVVALSQLSRKLEEREDKRPQLADLRESGSIEQDADVVGFVYRDEYYVERAVPQRRPGEADTDFNRREAAWQEHLARVKNKAELLIAKQRHGPIGTVELGFQGEFTRFYDLRSGDGAG